MTAALVPGSLGAVAQRDGVSVAESFLSADVIVLIDASGSMRSQDGEGDQTRWARACDELKNLQASLPWRIAVVGFSGSPQFASGGIAIFQGGGTDLAAALKFVQPADGTVKFVVISDGHPDDAEACLRLARTFESVIDTIFIGSEDGHGKGFLKKIAAASGGKSVTTAGAMGLEQEIRLMLAG